MRRQGRERRHYLTAPLRARRPAGKEEHFIAAHSAGDLPCHGRRDLRPPACQQPDDGRRIGCATSKPAGGGHALVKVDCRRCVTAAGCFAQQFERPPREVRSVVRDPSGERAAHGDAVRLAQGDRDFPGKRQLLQDRVDFVVAIRPLPKHFQYQVDLRRAAPAQYLRHWPGPSSQASISRSQSPTSSVSGRRAGSIPARWSASRAPPGGSQTPRLKPLWICLRGLRKTVETNAKNSALRSGGTSGAGRRRRRTTDDQTDGGGSNASGATSNSASGAAYTWTEMVRSDQSPAGAVSSRATSRWIMSTIDSARIGLSRR